MSVAVWRCVDREGNDVVRESVSESVEESVDSWL